MKKVAQYTSSSMDLVSRISPATIVRTLRYIGFRT
jgi:hypothetical protein